jgi:hypothetical protein
LRERFGKRVLSFAAFYRPFIAKSCIATCRPETAPIALLAMALPFMLLIAAAAQSTVASIDPRHRLIEGVATNGRTIWVSSILDRTIIACRGTCRDLTVLPSGLHPFAIAWDSARGRLWVAADCPPGVPGIKACQRGAMLALDIRGRIRTRISPFVGEFHPGDVSVGRGQVFVSDSQNGMVFRLTKNERGLMAVVLPDTGKSAQGTALDRTGRQLIVADYSQGIGITDLDAFKRKLLPRQDGKPLRGIDGLVRCGSIYYGIYNGAAPGRLLSFTTDGKTLHVKEPLPELKLPDPTQLAYEGRRLLIVADSGWASVDKQDAPRALGAAIVAVPLSRNCAPE